MGSERFNFPKYAPNLNHLTCFWTERNEFDEENAPRHLKSLRYDGGYTKEFELLVRLNPNLTEVTQQYEFPTNNRLLSLLRETGLHKTLTTLRTIVLIFDQQFPLVDNLATFASLQKIELILMLREFDGVIETITAFRAMPHLHDLGISINWYAMNRNEVEQFLMSVATENFSRNLKKFHVELLTQEPYEDIWNRFVEMMPITCDCTRENPYWT